MSPWQAIASITGGEYKRLLRGLEDCAAAQRLRLGRLLRANAETVFGRGLRFDRIRDPDQYRARVPLQGYDDLAVGIEKTAGGTEGTLLGEPVLLFEETGGSGGGAKLIPYSEASLAGFRRAVHPWLHDLTQCFPRLGRGYFTISPAARPPRATASGISVGAASDAVYFGSELSKSLAAVSLAPVQLGSVANMHQWQRLALSYLLRAEDLTFISLWSPSFITALLAELPAHAEALLRELHDGAPAALSDAPPWAPSPQRAAVVAGALAGEGIDTSRLWPRLQLISCWTHAGAARFIPELQRLFPYAALQGKGLLATEGAVSLPLNGYAYPVLAVNSGFYEFLDPTECSHLAHELTEGRDYEVVLTVPGLYRYRIGDRVRVRGWAGTAPQLEFIGRHGLVSDLVGEKLSEPFVAECLRDIQGFAMLAPALEPQPHYRLYVERSDAALQVRVERALRTNPQYAHGRDLGQLGSLCVVPVVGPLQRYHAWALARGQRLGDIKPPSLRPETDWERRFRCAQPADPGNPLPSAL